MALTKYTRNSFKDGEVKTANINDGAVTNAKLGDDAVAAAAKITDGTITADDLSSTLDLSSKTVTIPDASFNNQFYNVGLLGFKMAVTESLTVFNLVDGVVDEFHDESGTDEAEGSNDLYCASSDFYQNQTSPVSYAGNFGVASVTEEDTSEAGTNPAQGTTCRAQFTVPTGVTQVTARLFGGGGGTGNNSQNGGGAGFSEGEMTVTPGQVLDIFVGEGGGGDSEGAPSPPTTLNGGGVGGGFGTGPEAGGGGGGSFILASESASSDTLSAPDAPKLFIAAGGGGGAGELTSGGSGGGLVGNAGGSDPGAEQTTNLGGEGGGGGQTTGGVGGDNEIAQGTGAIFEGGQGDPGFGAAGGGGGGYYGGGGGSNEEAGGGGSAYLGHPQLTSGTTDDNDGGRFQSSQPGYDPTAKYGGGADYNAPGYRGYDGYILLTATGTGSTTSTTIVSNAFTANSAPSTSRIVVFQENVDTPTLNTDIIASISRDGGSNFTNVTLVDEGYVTGSSGQRVLAGLVDISGQPSGTSMRWKLALANDVSKIHGVSLSWA
jgi:hypothetical protein